MDTTTLIIGASGQLGTAFRNLLPRATPIMREHADLAKPDMLRALIAAHRPAVVINCAAYNVVDRAETDLTGAFAVNAFAVRELAIACGEIGATLVHFSTNYVFGHDEVRRRLYEESDAPGPISAYGISKLAGEYFAQSLCPRHLVIRTCGLYGFVERKDQPVNFIEKLLDRVRRGEKLRVVNDQACTPTAVENLAEATLNLLRAGAHGLHHYTNAGACTWHEFATEVVRCAELRVAVEAVGSGEFAAPARRPAYSVLACAAYDRHGFGPRPTWQAALHEYFVRRGKEN